MKFESGEQMLYYINHSHDLYSPSQKTYIYTCDGVGSVCACDVNTNEATNLARKCQGTAQEWGDVLEWGGLYYYDPYSDFYNPNEMSNLELCERLKDVDDWCACSAWLEHVAASKTQIV